MGQGEYGGGFSGNNCATLTYRFRQQRNILFRDLACRFKHPLGDHWHGGFALRAGNRDRDPIVFQNGNQFIGQTGIAMVGVGVYKVEYLVLLGWAL